jgi:hypothetical protein
MNWSENDEAAMPAEAQAPDASQASANTLFMGDSGELALDTGAPWCSYLRDLRSTDVDIQSSGRYWCETKR